MLSKKTFFFTVLIFALPMSVYVVSATSYLVRCTQSRSSCLEHRKAGCNISGEYNISAGNINAAVSCDMETDDGGWILIGNYLHRGGSPGAALVLEKGNFPIQKNDVLGIDEFSTASWGHISTAMLSQINFSEVRFRCQTSEHQRLVDFTVWSPFCLDYFRTGKGSCSNSAEQQQSLVKKYRPLPGSEALLPATADKGWKDQGDFSLVNYPFFVDYKNHWAVGRLPSRFECDNYDAGGKSNTWHQVFVR